MTDVYWYFSFGLLCLYHQGETKVYESVQWTAQSPKFGDEVFHLNVLPNSVLNVVCPNPAIVVAEMQNTPSKEELLENFWIVDESSFNNCAVNKSIADNRILMSCTEPSKMNFLSLVFQQFSALANDPRFLPGKMYYFISTSDGTLKSLNNTSNGHCRSRNMRMEIYVCRDSQDEACQPTEAPSLPHRNATTVELATQESRKSPPRNIWQLLTIIFGVGFAVSMVIHSICLFCVCHRKTDKKQRMENACPQPQQSEDEKGLENIQVSCNV